MDWLFSTLVICSVIIGVAVWLKSGQSSSHRQQDPSANAMLQQQISSTSEQATRQMETLRAGLQENMQQLNEHLVRSLAENNKTVGDRLENTSKVMGDVRERLGKLDESSKRIAALGEDISSLQEILQPPKLRGALGELFLGEILAQILPGEHYQLQYHFKGGEAVDAVVKLRNGMVPIDAKFPLENFKRILAASDEETRVPAKKQFIRDVKLHIDAIASKYIRTDEGTFDFALMYIPAENVYYETIIKDSEVNVDMGLFNYALAKRVIPVSPNNLYAYLQTVMLGLKGMKVEEGARDIINNLSRLEKEFERFGEAFRLVGTHLENAQKKYLEAEKRHGKVESKLEQIDGMVKGLDGPEAQALASGNDS